jgi:hypothetical protein
MYAYPIIIPMPRRKLPKYCARGAASSKVRNELQDYLNEVAQKLPARF